MQQHGHRLGIWKACVADTVPESQRYVPDRADLHHPDNLRRRVEQDGKCQVGVPFSFFGLSRESTGPRAPRDGSAEGLAKEAKLTQIVAVVWHHAADDIRRYSRQDAHLYLVCPGLHEPPLGGHGDAVLGWMYTAGEGMAPLRQGDMLEPQRDYHIQHLYER